jgi:putative membrane protein
MDRRNALMTFSGLLASSALIAVPQRPVLAQADTPARITMTQYKSQTLEAGNFSKQVSQLAVRNANNPRVRQFAEFEVVEQTTVAQVLTSSTNPDPIALDTQQAMVLGQLQAQSGKDFDAAYVQAQMAGHRQLLNIQQAFLNGALVDQAYEPVAVMARMVIQMHMTMLQDLQNQLSA